MQNVEVIENALTEFKKHNITEDKLETRRKPNRRYISKNEIRRYAINISKI